MRVAEIMTKGALTIGPGASIDAARELMRRRSVRSLVVRENGEVVGVVSDRGCLPVIERGHLVGIVTVSDLLELVGRGVDRPMPFERPALFHRVPHKRRTRRTASW